MKKVLLALFTLALCLSSLFANEAAVKQVIIDELKLCAAGDLKSALKYYSRNFVSINLDKGRKLYYHEMELMATSLDGKHPEEFMLMIVQIQTGKAPTAEQAKELKKMAQSEQIKAVYQKYCDEIMSLAIKTSKIELQTLKFMKVDVKGNNATVVKKYQTIDTANKSLTRKVWKQSTIKMHKVNGSWKIYESSMKKID